MFLDIQTQARLHARFFQYSILSAPLAAVLQDLPQKQIQNGFHFWSEFMTITYNTVTVAGADDGVCQLSAQFKSGSNQIGLSNYFIDLATVATPGRQRTVAVAGDPSNGLQIQGFPWPYLYEAAGAIIVDLRKSIAAAITTKFVWTGFLIPTYMCPTAQHFYNVLAQNNPSFGNPQIQA